MRNLENTMQRPFRLTSSVVFIALAIGFAVTQWAFNRYVPPDTGLPEALAILL